MRFMNRKLLILLSVVVLVLVAGSAFVVVRKYQNNRKVQQFRVEGMKAFEAGDDQLAVKHLQNYLISYGDDIEVLYRYALVRERVPLKKYQHARRAMSALRRVLELAPEHPSARLELLKLYRRYGLATEAVKLSAEVLRARPDDAEVLQTRTWALMVVMRHKEALETVRQALKQHPRDLENRFLELELMRRTGLSDGQIAAKVRQNRMQNADDLRFVLFEAVAARMAADRSAALEDLQRFDDVDLSDDADLLVAVTRELDAWGQYERSMQLLGKTASQSTDPTIRRLYADRLWQMQQIGDLLGFLADVSPDDPKADTRMLVLKALASAARLDKAPLQAIAEALARRHGDPVAEAWASVIKLGPTDGTRDNAAAVKIHRAAVERAPGEPALRLMLARGLRAQGKPRAALEHLFVAARLGSAWARPWIEIAKTHGQMGQPRQTFRAARQAFERAPKSIGAAVALAEAAAGGDMEFLTPAALLELVSQIQHSAPGEARTLPLYVTLLARAGDRDQAVAVVRSAIQADKVPPLRTLLMLAEVSGKQDLGLASELFDHCEQAYGISASLAVARAVHQFAKQKDAVAAVRTFERDAARVELERDAVSWRVARARLLEKIDHDDAAASWVALANAYPQRLVIQSQAIQAASVRDRRDFLDRAIKRMRELDDQDSAVWRLARARWLLRGDDSTDAAAEAASLLNEALSMSFGNTEAHLLLATCLRRLDDRGGAIEYLQKAANARPDSVDIALNLAEWLQSDRNFDAAGPHIDRALEQSLNPQQCRRAAALLARQGDSGRAIKILRGALVDDGDEQAPDLLLAVLYRHRNESDKARAVLEQLLAEDSADREPSQRLLLLAYAADFFAAQDEPERAQATLAGLDDLVLDPGVADLVLAQHHLRHGSAAQAAEYYLAATAAAPRSPQAWIQRFSVDLQRGQTEQALETADKALEQLPDHAGFQAVRHHREIILQTRPLSALRPLAIAILGSSEYRDVAAETLTLLVTTAKKKEPVIHAIPRLRQLAERNPYFLPLQTLTATIFNAAGQQEEAIRLVTRAMQAFPGEAQPARLGAGFLIAARRFDEALGVAQQWRRRDPRHVMAADLLLAQCRLELDQPHQALAILEPYLDGASAESDGSFQLFERAARAYLALKQADDAASLLRPLLAQGARWRNLWGRFAMGAAQDRATAEQWLQELEAGTPDDAVQERLALAIAWGDLGDRFAAETWRDKRREMVIALAAHPKATAQVHFLRGAMAESDGDLATAEAAYRQALAKDDGHFLAMNNLAIVLADQNKDLDEAIRLAKDIVRLRPDDPNLLDTLAHVHQAAGLHDEALRYIRKVIALEPEAILWRINEAWLLSARRQDRTSAPQVSGTGAGPPRAAGPARKLSQAPAGRRRTPCINLASAVGVALRMLRCVAQSR